MYAADAGANDTYTATLSPAISAYVTGAHYFFKANTANTGAATINFNSLGAKSIKRLHDQDPDDGCIESGSIVEVAYDGTNMQMLSPCATTTAGSSGLNLIEQHTASTSASLDFTTCISGTYDTYQFELLNILPATDGAFLHMRVSTDGGSTWVTATDYSYQAFRFNGGSAAGSGTGQTAIVFSETNGIGNAASFGLVGTLKLYSPGSTSVHKAVNGQIQFRNTTALRIVHIVSGIYEQNTAVNAVQFFASTGNLTSGTIRCYGLAK
jgi:hypothetical protein